MGVLGNFQHEKFCQEVHKRTWAGSKVKEAREIAYVAAGFQADQEYLAANARKLANRKEIKARLAELADYAAKLAGIEAGWGQLKLKSLVEANLDDYLTPTDSDGNRYFNIGDVSAEKLALLSEYSQDETTETDEDDKPRSIRKVRVKMHDRIAALRLMAEIAGWKAPTKVAPTNPAGDGPAAVNGNIIIELVDAAPRD